MKGVVSTYPCPSLKGEIVKWSFTLCNYSLIAILIACTLSSCKVNVQILYLTAVVKNLPAKAGDSGDAGLIPKWGMIPRRGKWQAFQFPNLLAWESHGQRSLAGCPWGGKELDTPGQLNTHILASTSHKPFWPCSSYYRMMVAYFFTNVQVITRWNGNSLGYLKLLCEGKN